MEYRPENCVVVATFERSGTHLAIDFIRRNFAACRLRRFPGEYLEMAFVNLDRIGRRPVWPTTVEKTLRHLRRGRRPVVKTHTSPELELFAPGPSLDLASDLLGQARVVHVVRDPRRVLASYQLLVEGKPSATPADFERFLFGPHRGGDESPVERWIRHFRSWDRARNTLRLRYEDIVRDPVAVRGHLAEFLELPPAAVKNPLPPKITSPWQRRLMRLFQLNPSSTAVLGRGGDLSNRPVDWRKAMDPGCRERFHGALGEELVRLGYESDASWTEPSTAGV